MAAYSLQSLGAMEMVCLPKHRSIKLVVEFNVEIFFLHLTKKEQESLLCFELNPKVNVLIHSNDEANMLMLKA